MKIYWDTYKTINEFENSIWDNKIALNKPFLSSKFMSVVEKTQPNDFFFYFIAKNETNEIIAIGFNYISKLDLLQQYSNNNFIKNIRNLFPAFMKINVGMTATWETCGNHLWFDTNYLDYETFSIHFLKKLNETCKNQTIMVWRDYIEDENKKILTQNKKIGFVNADTISISKIYLKKEITEESYIYEIKKKHRNYMKKIIRERNEQKLKIEFIENYLPLLDSVLYPLYSNVNKNAKEYQTSMLPKSFFENVKKTWKSNSEILVVKDDKDTILAFVLLVKDENILNPFLIGMDYSKREYNLWYHCTWESIMYAIKNNLTEIDLGATNFSMKQKLGAVQIKNEISLKFRNKIMNLLFKKILINFA